MNKRGFSIDIVWGAASSSNELMNAKPEGQRFVRFRSGGAKSIEKKTRVGRVSHIIRFYFGGDR